MLARLKREWSGFFTHGGQIALLLFGLHANTRDAWLFSLAAIALISLFIWLHVLRRLRLVRGTPTSRIASAAQGYVEVVGRGRQYGTPLVSPLTLLPCLWFSYRVYRKNGDKWELEDQGESEEPFLLDDGSGQCVVDPSGAEVLPQRKDTWTRDNRRYVEALLLENERLYVIGLFRTVGGASVYLNPDEEIRSVLAEWKQDKKALLERFDLNRDGEIDMDEWLLARQAARREAERRIAAVRAEPDTHYLLQPGDGRPFIISAQSQERLARRYALLSFVHPAIFLGALAATGWLLAGNPWPPH